MVRRSLVGSGSTPADRAAPLEPIEVSLVEFGPFPEITPLNPRFVPGRPRLKLTLDVNLSARAAGRSPADFIQPLEALLPSLSKHRCCGDHRIRETFFTSGRRPSCAMRETDDSVDIAHLFEHLVIDFQHSVADMRICSGVTCGYERPRHRYDVFVESAGQGVGVLCVDLARHLMNDLLRGGSLDPIYAGVVELARHFHRNPGGPLSSMACARLLAGEPRTREALQILLDASFIREMETSVNFSRVELFELVRDWSWRSWN